MSYTLARYTPNQVDTEKRYDLSIRPGMSICTYVSCLARGAAFAVLDEVKSWLPEVVTKRMKNAAVAGALAAASLAGVIGVYEVSAPIPAAKAVVSSACVGSVSGLDSMILTMTEVTPGQSGQMSLLEVLGIGNLEPCTSTYRLPDIKLTSR